MEKSDYTILLVDDEEDILDFVGYNLRKEGYHVVTTSNGKDALESVKKNIPHLILLDLMMPEMDGMETCKELKKNPLLNDTLIVFFTARNEDFTQIMGLDAGADDYITKPFSLSVLRARVNTQLRKQASNHKNARCCAAILPCRLPIQEKPIRQATLLLIWINIWCMPRDRKYNWRAKSLNS